MNKHPIYIFADYYLPGFKAGGPIKSISTVVDIIKDHYDVTVITRDRDAGDRVGYDNVKVDRSNFNNNVKVIYLSPGILGQFAMFSVLFKSSNCSIFYFNSFFSLKFSIIPQIFLFFMGFFKCMCVKLIAPRGELNKGAINFKSRKKHIWMCIFNRMNFKDVYYHATNHEESKSISRYLKVNAQLIFTISNVSKSFKESKGAINASFNTKKIGELSLIYLARIHPIKGLYFVLDLLKNSKDRVSLDIFGPIEDVEYWNACQAIILSMPKNISINYGGSYNKNIISLISSYDALILHTAGENYGHVIYESIAANTPVIVSDRTPWTPDKCDAVYVIPFGSVSDWMVCINILSDMNSTQHYRLRQIAQQYVLDFNHNDDIEDNYRKIFKYLTCRTFCE
jgi:glycosyltransferase involved in cell wall biosynthesis